MSIPGLFSDKIWESKVILFSSKYCCLNNCFCIIVLYLDPDLLAMKFAEKSFTLATNYLDIIFFLRPTLSNLTFLFRFFRW
jgi:hypothetical protein